MEFLYFYLRGEGTVKNNNNRSYTHYDVIKRDTLWDLFEEFRITIGLHKKYNQLSSGTLSADQVLNVNEYHEIKEGLA